MTTLSCSDLLRELIRKQGSIPFSTFMETALYHDDCGYYSGKHQAVGKSGDFITSVSVGSCFGHILAARMCCIWDMLGKPSEFHIIEPGAHDGQLCEDILTSLECNYPACFNATSYHLIETTPRLREMQCSRLQRFSNKVHTRARIESVRVEHGVVLSNELFDALPIDLLQFQNGTWQQRLVTLDGDGEFFWDHKPISHHNQIAFCQELGNDFPDGYLVEFQPTTEGLIKQLSETLNTGYFITIDYGFTADELYSPLRTQGTLQTYQKHQRDDNPLASPGDCDLTCHVNFSRLIALSQAAGWGQPVLRSQASYLTEHARSWLIEMEKNGIDQQLLREFQTLTHPSMLGSKFQVLEMTKGHL